MLEFIRRYQKPLQVVLFVVGFPGFVLYGIQSYVATGSGNDTIATVAGHKISRQQFDAAHKVQVERLKKLFGDVLDDSIVNGPRARQMTMDELVREYLQDQAAKDRRLTVSEQAVIEHVRNAPELRQFRKEDGSIDLEKLSTALRASQMTFQGLINSMREQGRRDLVTDALANSGFVSQRLAQYAYGIATAKREARVLSVELAPYLKQYQASDADARAWYEAHPKPYERPEGVAVQYVLLDPKYLAARSQASEEELRKLYDANVKAGRYVTPESRRASHILLAAATAEEKQKIKPQAEKVLAEVEAHPDQFADLAKQYSQDPGSSAQGGDLGVFKRGAMTKPFEDAVFGMQVGQISKLVETQFGFHIIKLTEIQPSKQQSFEEVRAELQADVSKGKLQESTDKINKLLGEATDLQPFAKETGATIHETKWVYADAKFNSELEAARLFQNREVLRALFNPDVARAHHNTALITVPDAGQVALRVTDYRPKGRLPFEEVKASAAHNWSLDQALKQAVTEGHKKLEAVRQSKNLDGFGQPIVIERSNPEKSGFSADEVAQIFAPPAASLPAFVGIEAPSHGYAVVYVLNEVRQAPSEKLQQNLQNELARVLTGAEQTAFLDDLKRIYPVNAKIPGAEAEAKANTPPEKP